MPRVALPITLSVSAWPDPAARVTAIDGAAFGTGWRVRFVGEGDLRGAIEARLAAIDAQMSQWRADSVLSRFNRSPAGTWTHLPPDFAVVIAHALGVAAASGGAFDPTWGRSAALLGYGADPPGDAPTPAALAHAAARSGWRRLDFDPAGARLRQPGELWLDLSGIAKGYAVDAVSTLLAARGVAHSLVEIGGELAGRGVKPGGQPWWVDLETPPGFRTRPLRVALHGLAVATSGDGVRGGHTLSPATGRPTAPLVASVSVVAADAMTADAWATALTVLGPDAGVAMADERALAARMLLRRGDGGEERISRALQAMIEDDR